MKKTLISALLAGVSSLWAMADNEWIHIYTTSQKGTTEVESLAPSKISEIKYQEVEDDRYDAMRIFTADGEILTRRMDAMDSLVVGRHVPTMYINIENNAEVVVKDQYLNATISIEGNGVVDDFEEAEVTIKGRGNSTWFQFPKKPWRLKFAKKQEFCGLKKAKNFALIANFIDPSNMRNTVAFRIAHLLDMPWTNSSVPVNIVMNGTYRGIYMVTEKIGINGASVDIDETQGILWEFDTNYDENYKFRSSGVGLPVMVKDPDFDELYEADPTGPTPSQRLQSWASDFNAMEAAVLGRSYTDWTELLDLESAVKYVFVNALAGNDEPCWPKSVYMHKATKEDKYVFGPVWDFDWAYTFGGSYEEGVGNPNSTWLSKTYESGGAFFQYLVKDERFMAAFRELLDRFYDEEMDGLMEFIDEYSTLIRPAAYQNGARWPQGSSTNHPGVMSSDHFDEHLTNLKNYLKTRIEFMHSHRNCGLY